MPIIENGDKSDHVSIGGYAEYNTIQYNTIQYNTINLDGNNHHFEGQNVDIVTQINRSASTTSRMVTSRTRYLVFVLESSYDN